jgi:predicted transcriptional regulator/predicted RNA-binding Zn-ribbon protein involved in translation (DUF1610 family)
MRKLADMVVRVKNKPLEPIEGFPQEGKFKTMGEVKAYLSGEKIQCLLCGKVFKMLGAHLVKSHGMDADGYRDHFGIPSTFGLSGTLTHSRFSAARKLENAKNPEAVMERLKMAHAALRLSKGTPRRAFPALTDSRRKASKSNSLMCSLPTDDLVETHCSKCGVPIRRSTHSIKLLGHRLTCNDCQDAYQKAFRKERNRKLTAARRAQASTLKAKG